MRWHKQSCLPGRNGAVLPGDLWKVLAFPSLLRLAVNGKTGVLERGRNVTAFTAPEPSPNFSKREENSTRACFTLAGAPESALLTLLGLPGHVSQAGHLLHPQTAVCLALKAWKIPWTEEPDGLQSMGLQRVEHDWVTSMRTHTHTHTHTEVCSGPLAPGPPVAFAALLHLKGTNYSWFCILCAGLLWEAQDLPPGACPSTPAYRPRLSNLSPTRNSCSWKPCPLLSHPMPAQSLGSPWSSGFLFWTQVIRSDKGITTLNIF